MIFLIITILALAILFHECFMLKKVKSFLKRIKDFVIEYLLTPFSICFSLGAIYVCCAIYFNWHDWQTNLYLNFPENEKPIKIISFLKNIFLGLIPLIGFPLLVWQNKNAYEAKETAKKNLEATLENNQKNQENTQKSFEETQRNNRRTQENNMFVKCVEQLANPQETIRTASIHGFHELLNSAKREIENTADEKIKQERIDFQDKVLNILWSFMVEHSRIIFSFIEKARKEKERGEVLIQNYRQSGNIQDYNEMVSSAQIHAEFSEKKDDLVKSHHPQFRLIMEILAEFRNRHYDEEAKKIFWRAKWWKDIYLHGIDLSHANLKKIYLNGASLKDAILIYTDLEYASIGFCNLTGASLRNTNLNYAFLDGADFTANRLSHISMVDASISDAVFENCFLIKVDLTNANLEGANFASARLNNVTLVNANLKHVHFTHANLTTCGSSLSQALNLEYAFYTDIQSFYGGKSFPKTLFPKNFNPKEYGMNPIH